MKNENKVGYGRPPKHTRFKPGVSGNPTGRKKQPPITLAKVIADELNAPVAYRERGRTKYMARQELAIKTLIDQAVQGHLGAAEQVLKLRAHAQRFGDVGAQRLLITDWLPDFPGQTAERKTAAFASTSPTEPPTWWTDEPKR